MGISINEVISREVVTIDSSKTAVEAAKLMTQKKIGALLILEDCKLAGIITERDLVRRVYSAELNPKEVKVSSFMSKPVITAESNLDLGEAAALMSTHKIRRLPIVEKGKIVGILTSRDIVSHFMKYFSHWVW